MKNVLLVSTPYMGIYCDVKLYLEKKGYFVDCIAQKAFPNDPFSKETRYNRLIFSKKKYLRNIEQFWRNKLSEEVYKKKYDYLIVINGVFVHPILFSILRLNNKDIKCINYLVDSMRVYEFERLFPYYDKVYTFDRRDYVKFGLELLPIYWIPEPHCEKIERDVFALGGFKYDRYRIFRQIKEISTKFGLDSFIKVYLPACSIGRLHGLYRKVKFFFKIGKPSLDDDLIIQEPITTSDYRHMINSSRIIVDTILDKQTGLTSRLIWAVGLGKKVITNNSDIINYPFYNPRRFCVINDRNVEIPSYFLYDEYNESDSERKIINTYRIDNWVEILLGIRNNLR